jgi:molybdenum cofactor biosynthesis enzyme MoaA
MNLQFEVTTVCNSRCSFCPRDKMKRQGGIMSEKLFHKIIKEGKEFGISTYAPFLNGELFTFNKIYDWLDYMKKEGCLVSIHTNAELMDVDKMIKYTNIRMVNCSIAAATKETYEKIQKGPDFDRVVKNTKDLIARAPYKVWVSMVVCEDNEHEKQMFIDMWGENAKFAKFANYAGAKHDKIERLGRRKPCAHLLRPVTILWDGRAALCCMDYDGQVILGDFNKESLVEINKRYELLRERHNKLDFNMPLCIDCNKNT